MFHFSILLLLLTQFHPTKKDRSFFEKNCEKTEHVRYEYVLFQSLTVLESRIDRFTLKCENPKYTLMNAVQRFLVYETLQ